MSFERVTGPGAEPLPVRANTDADATPVSVRLQILSTEHWSLLSSRSLAWNESFSRSAMFLATLSAAVVALALVAQASDFGSGFRLFALVILPVVLFVGIATLFRIGASNYHDALCVRGMNRIRAGYLELVPELERYFVTGVHDDRRGMLVTMALDPRQPTFVHMLGATPMLVATLNSFLFATIVALLAIEVGSSNAVGVALGATGFFVAQALHFLWGRRVIAAGAAAIRSEFPTRPPRPEPGRRVSFRRAAPSPSGAGTARAAAFRCAAAREATAE